MTSFVRRFSISSSPPPNDTAPSPRRKSSGSNGRVLGARDYKLATSPAGTGPYPQNTFDVRRASEITLTNDDMDAGSRRPGRILGTRDYQQAISAEELQRRRSSVASTLVEGKAPVLTNRAAAAAAAAADDDGVGGDGRIYGARDYKLNTAAGRARKMSGAA